MGGIIGSGHLCVDLIVQPGPEEETHIAAQTISSSGLLLQGDSTMVLGSM